MGVRTVAAETLDSRTEMPPVEPTRMALDHRTDASRAPGTGNSAPPARRSRWCVAYRWTSDVSPAAWIAERLHPWFLDTGSVVPEGFDAYVRVFHPAGESGTERWADIARRNGRIAHPEMQLHLISRPVGARAGDRHDLGQGFRSGLSAETCAVLVEKLSAYERCWFCVWEGYGGLDDQGVTARVIHPERAYLLAGGPVADAVPAWDEQSPNLWWPEDRAWLVVSEIDFAWTYVGGSSGLIGDLLAEPPWRRCPPS
jgi:hypothetical protein